MPQRTTSPLHMRVVLERLDRLDALYDTPTKEIPAVKPSQVQHRSASALHPSLAVAPRLPRDRLGRPFVCMTDEQGYTLELVQTAVKRFVEVQECAPTVILLSAWRWLDFGSQMGFYFPRKGRPIPYAYEAGYGCDVLVRGAFDGN